MTIDTKKIGKEYPPVTYEVGKEKIKEFARAIKSKDPHYFDDEFAKNTKYKTIIAPPLFATVFHAALIDPIISDFNIDKKMVIHVYQSYEFQEVVKSGDIIATSSKITKIINSPDNDLIGIELHSKNQNGKDVCKGNYTFIIRKISYKEKI